MKTILVDAVFCFITDKVIDQELYALLESYPNRKLLLTSANEEQAQQFGLIHLPYELFSLKHNPEKFDPAYYRAMLKHFGLSAKDVVYFEHSKKAVESARSVGIATHYYDSLARDLTALKKFLDEHL